MAMSVTSGSRYSAKAKPWNMISMVSISKLRYTNLGYTSALLDQVETLELSKTLQQLHDLLVIEVSRDTTNEKLVW